MLATDRSPSMAPVELEELLARCVGNIEFAQRVLARFVASFGDDIDRLERCFQLHQPEELARIAHAMKGAAANVAAHGLEEQIGRIEEMARSRRLEDFTSCLTPLRDEWSRVSNTVSAIGARGD
jgi:HPt (histidine-containing phosphotransfer) domain-containing protein